MTILTILVIAVAGGGWRRWMGGWPAGAGVLAKRWPKLLAALLLGFLACWPSVSWYAALILSAVAMVYWLPHHELQEWSALKWWHRYGPIGWCWWLANKFPIKRINDAIDGSNALAEMAAGAIVYGGLAALAWLS